jgi:hypothetical protein
MKATYFLGLIDSVREVLWPLFLIDNRNYYGIRIQNGLWGNTGCWSAKSKEWRGIGEYGGSGLWRRLSEMVKGFESVLENRVLMCSVLLMKIQNTGEVQQN